MSGYERALNNREWANARLRDVERAVEEANRRGARPGTAPDFGAGPTFVPLVLQNGWTAFPDTWTVPRAWVRDGVLHLDGLMQAGTTAANTLLFTLPEGMRPSSGIVLGTVDFDGNTRSLSVNASGAVVIHTTVAAGTYMSLCNVRIPLAVDYLPPGGDFEAGYSSYGGVFRGAGYGIDSYGFLRPTGLLRGSGLQPDNTRLLRLPTSANVQAAHQRHMLATAGGTVGVIGASREHGGITTKTGTIGTAYQTTDGPALATAAAPAFTEATLENGWTRRATDDNRFPRPAFVKRPDGIVVLEGLCRDGLVGSTVFTLPEGHRPAMALRFAAASNGALGKVDVFPDGRVVLNAGSNVWLSFDGLSFYGEV